MKRFGFAVILLIVIVGGILLVGTFWWRSNTSALTSTENFQSFVIPKGRSAMQVGSKLEDEELIKSSLAFKIYVQVFGKSKSINAGEFKLSPSMSLVEIIEALGEGPLELWVTIPEGLRREEIIERYVKDLEMGAEEFEFRLEFLSLTKDNEGYLFPDTYLFPRDATADLIVKTMLSNFEKKTNEFQDGIDNSKYSLNQIVTMASIIERETKTNEERSVVAGILFKRLETEGWLVQADATIQYAVAGKECPGRNTAPIVCPEEIIKTINWWPILTKDDLEIDSPYNSYKYKALPPTPIANPGLSSINAAIFPEDSPYWFYIHDSDAKIHYGKTISEHNSNVRRYLGK